MTTIARIMCVALALVACCPAIVGAEDAKDHDHWYDRLDFKGDIRLRYEGFNQDGSFDDDQRDRFRIRLRAGIEAAVTDKLKVGLQLRNGDPNDPVSNNTSFDGGFQFKEFNLAQGFVQYTVNDSVELIGGKFDAGKRWTVSDMQWDDDVTVEGLMQNFNLDGSAGSYSGLDIATYQYILEESKSGSDAYLFGGQAGAGFAIGDKGKMTVGAGFDFWENPDAVVRLTQSGDLGGNKVTNLLDADGNLVSDFEIANLFFTYKNSIADGWPVKLNLHYYQNLGADGIGKDHDTAYFGRLQIGDYKKPRQVAFRYSYYSSEPDALFYVFTQSDTSRGSDLKAHRFDVRVGAIAHSYVNLTWYITDANSYDDETLNRWQMDYVIKF